MLARHFIPTTITRDFLKFSSPLHNTLEVYIAERHESLKTIFLPSVYVVYAIMSSLRNIRYAGNASTWLSYRNRAFIFSSCALWTRVNFARWDDVITLWVRLVKNKKEEMKEKKS